MIALIPARGGSKRIARKNTKLLCGKPLIAYTIEAALASKSVSKVYVSTDDEEIAQIALEFGAEVPFMRPDFLATDLAKSIDVYTYTCQRLEEEVGFQISELMVLQPTSPLREFWHIDQAYDLFRAKKADSVISFCKEHHPIVWHKYLEVDQSLTPIFEETFRNSQDDRPSYFPNGAIYIFKRELLDKGIYMTNKSFAYIMDRKYSVDIDTEDDWMLAQCYLKAKYSIGH